MKGGLLNSLSLGFVSRAAIWHPNTQLTNPKTVPFLCREQIYKPNSEIFISESLLCHWLFGYLQQSTDLVSINDKHTVWRRIGTICNRSTGTQQNVYMPGQFPQAYSRIVCTSQVSLPWLWKWILFPANIGVWATQVSSPWGMADSGCSQGRRIAGFLGRLCL